MQSIKLRSKQKQHNTSILINLQKTKRGYVCLNGGVESSTKIRISKSGNPGHVPTHGLQVEYRPTPTDRPNGYSAEKHPVPLAEAGLKALRAKEEHYENKVAVAMAREEHLPSTVHHTQPWYQAGQVDPIETQSLPEFFNGQRKSKTPELYVRYRDYMIGLYRQSPRKYVNFTTIRRCLAGDVNGLMKIFRFLEKKGLINYNCNPLYSVALDGVAPVGQEVYSRVNGQLDYSWLHRKDDYKYDIDMLNQQVKYLNYKLRVFCNHCQEVCNSFWYQSKQKSALGYLCVECYLFMVQKGKITSQAYSKQDLVQKQVQPNDEPQQTKQFNAQDTQKLIEGMIKPEGPPGEHQQETVLHLMQLPFKNVSQDSLRQDHQEQVDQIRKVDTQSQFYFQNLRRDGVKLVDYVYQMVDEINEYNGALLEKDAREGEADSEVTRGESEQGQMGLDKALQLCIAMGEAIQEGCHHQGRLARFQQQLQIFMNYQKSVHYFLKDDKEKSEYVMRLLQYSQVFKLKVVQAHLEREEEGVRQERLNIDVYRHQAIRGSVEAQMKANQAINTHLQVQDNHSNKIYIKLNPDHDYDTYNYLI